MPWQVCSQERMPERFLKQFYGMASWPLGSFQCLGLSSLDTVPVACRRVSLIQFGEKLAVIRS